MLEAPLSVTKSFTLSANQKSLLRYLLYFDLFNHPLTPNELAKSIDKNESVKEVISSLVERGVIFFDEDHYSLKNESANVLNRAKGHRRAINAKPKALERAKFIFNFPYVKGVYISGSMSKGVLEENGDIDFFIVTKPGRLWLSRSILILFKKLFLFNSRKFFCLNYFIDSDHLEIEEKNVFTATELLTLIPVVQDGVHVDFTKSNSWVNKYYPYQRMAELDKVYKGNSLKKLFESFFSGVIGQYLDRFFMKLTMNVWKRKFEDFQPLDFELALKSRTYVSKHHPHNYQKKVLVAFEKRKADLEKQFDLDLTL